LNPEPQQVIQSIKRLRL